MSSAPKQPVTSHQPAEQNCYFSRIYQCIMIKDPLEKVKQTFACFDDYQSNSLLLNNNVSLEKIVEPGRPQKPALIDPRKVARRSMNTVEGRVILAHAIAHIEFNAINLALDAAYRFRDMPAEYYKDWLTVAKEESYHFTLLVDYLKMHGHQYGDFDAHDGLWEMVLQTDKSVLERMALVPRVLEARGLDVTQTMIKKLSSAGDKDLIACLDIIYKDEIGHVAIGSHWFKYCCQKESLDADKTFIKLLKKYQMKNAVRGPFDEWARLQAGFSSDEINNLKSFEVSN